MLAQVQRLSPRRVALLAVLLAVAFAAILGACASAGAQHQLPAKSAVTPTGPGALVATDDWVTYRDPAGFFTIRIPPQWHATVSTGEGSNGNRTGSYSYTFESVNLGPGTGVPRDTYVGVIVAPIPNAFARQWYCTAWNGTANSTIAGLPATYFGWTWLLYTEDAAFQISTSFSFNPGGLPLVAVTPPPTPVPPATVSAGQQVFEAVISTFRPIPATPLKCG